MRRFAILFCAAVLTWAAEPTSDVKAAVLAAEDQWKAAVLKADKPALEKLIATDLSYTHSSGRTQTKEDFIQDIAGGTTTYKSIDFDETKLRQYGSTVVITHKAVIVTVQTGTSHLYLTEVWAREGDNWQLASRQATKLP